MLLEPRQNEPLTQDELSRYEEDCVAFYARCARGDLRDELEVVLARIVALRRELHGAFTRRQVQPAEDAMRQLLHLEAQAAALRRVYGEEELVPRAPPSGPQDRRQERRRTARE